MHTGGPQSTEVFAKEMSSLTNAPDLTRSFPRSPAEELGGYVLLARIVDKCRATIAGTNGEYRFNCPLDRQFFDFTGIDAEEFRELVASGASDEEIARWAREKDCAHSDAEILSWCYEQRCREPGTAEEKALYESLRRSAAPGFGHIRTWFELLDAEEGRVPQAR